MVIFNRWGQDIFTTNNIAKYWDGKINGKAAPEGSYTYYINIIGEDKRTFTKTGSVNVIY
jgi:gliding motility-associated-like protein